MSNNKWSEQEIEQLLSQAPKMNDVRSKEEVFNRLKQEQVIIKTPRKQRKWAPPAVAVAAILTLTLLFFLPLEDQFSLFLDFLRYSHLLTAYDLLILVKGLLDLKK